MPDGLQTMKSWPQNFITAIKIVFRQKHLKIPGPLLTSSANCYILLVISRRGSGSTFVSFHVKDLLPQVVAPSFLMAPLFQMKGNAAFGEKR